MKHLAFFATVLVLAAAIVGSTLMPAPVAESEQITLPITRVLACPVGSASLGKTIVTVTDQEVFVAGPLNTTSTSVAAAYFEDPATAVVIRGSATVGGVSQYKEADRTMVAPCSPPTTTGTWNGVMTQNASSTLILNNVDSSQAVVDVFLYGPTGPIPSPGLSDITVSPGAVQMLAIDQIVSSETAITVTMRASKGRVLATIRTTGAEGIDWQMPQANADTDLMVAGIPAGDGARTLSVTNTDPGAKAIVDVEILSETGAFPPLGFETVEVPPASAMNIDITQTFGGQASAVHLQSNQPVTAAVAVMGTDVAIISAQPTLNEAVVLPPLGGTIWLANPDSRSAIVSFRTEDERGVLQVVDRQVPPRSIMSAPFPSEGIWVRISTKSDSITAALVLENTSLSVLPVTGGGIATSVRVPTRDPGLG